MFCHLSASFQVEEYQFHSPNLYSFNMELGGQKWFIVGCYLAPDNSSMIYFVVAAISQYHHGSVLIVVRDFKSDLDEPEVHPCNKEITATILAEVLEKMFSHFLLIFIPWVWDGRTWIMFRQVIEVRSLMDSILVTDLCMFQNVLFRDLRHNTYHFMVLGCLQGTAQGEHVHYLRLRLRLPILLPRKPRLEDRMLSKLRHVRYWRKCFPISS